MDSLCEIPKDDIFDWDNFLESRDIVPVPNFAFQHVEKCQQSLLEDGMLVEVRHPTSQLPKFWLCYVTLKCGPFLRLKYFGQDEEQNEDCQSRKEEHEFWADPATAEIHPVGYCSSHGLCLEPPRELPNRKQLEKKAISLVNQYKAPDCDISLLSPFHQMKTGLRVELEDLHRSRTLWTGSIVKNIGGRLLIKYTLPPGVIVGSNATKCWIFCLSPRLHPQGWGNRAQWSYQPPLHLGHLAPVDAWAMLADRLRGRVKGQVSSDLHENLSKPCWNFQVPSGSHGYQVGDRVKAVDPNDPTDLHDAVVTEVVDEERYTVRLEGSNKLTLCCIGFQKKIEDDGDLGYEVNMALEVVDPWRPSQMCVGVVTQLLQEEGWMRIRMEGSSSHPSQEMVISIHSQDLFPVGWSESHSFPMKGPDPSPSTPPTKVKTPPSPTTSSGGEESTPSSGPAPSSTPSTSYWCPQIYFNFRCFSGPVLSKIRIAALPRSVGPGPILLVMKEVLSLLINGAYKPGAVLKQLQGERLPKGTQLEPLKAKHKQTTYRASVPVASTAADVLSYCRWVCDKLQCCPYLFGPELVGDPCPRKCCLLAKANWTNKKRPPNWRNRKFVDILKNLPLLDNKSTTGTKSAVGRGGDSGDDEHDSAVRGRTNDLGSQNDCHMMEEEGSPLRDSSTAFRGWTPESAKKTQPPVEGVVVKKKRGRPRKYPKPEDVPPSTIQQSPPPPPPPPTNLIHQVPSPQDPPVVPLNLPEEFAPFFPALRTLDQVETDPLRWGPKDLWHFVRSCSECRGLADRLLDQEVDGRSFMMMTLATVMDYVTLEFPVALRLCHLVGCLRLTYHQRFQPVG